MSELEDYQAAIAAEYGQFVATSAIFHDGVRAYNVGDPVPASNVKAHGYDKDKLVERVANKAEATAAAVQTDKKG